MTPRRMPVRPARAAAAGGLLAAVLTTGTSMPAAAAGGELLVSRDGIHFTADSTLPLLTSMGIVVPGDHSTEHVWVRTAQTSTPSCGSTWSVRAPAMPRSRPPSR